MERVYAPGGVVDGTVSLDRDEAHHLTRVRRVAVGEDVVAFDGQGHSWLCRLTDSNKTGACLEVIDRRPGASIEPLPELWLGTAVPKGDRFDWIVEKATELGVARLIPLVCERSVVEPRSTKLDRLRRSVIEACKQCGRDKLMEIVEPVRLETFLTSLPAGFTGLFADRGHVAMRNLRRTNEEHACVHACIGPEGGWTELERDLAGHTGWRPVSLGPHILRVETAAISMAAAVFQCFGDDDGPTAID